MLRQTRNPRQDRTIDGFKRQNYQATGLVVLVQARVIVQSQWNALGPHRVRDVHKPIIPRLPLL